MKKDISINHIFNAKSGPDVAPWKQVFLLLGMTLLLVVTIRTVAGDDLNSTDQDGNNFAGLFAGPFVFTILIAFIADFIYLLASFNKVSIFQRLRILVDVAGLTIYGLLIFS